MTPTITVFRIFSAAFRIYAGCEIGYRYFDLTLGCYWVRVRVSWNAIDLFSCSLRSGYGFDWNTRRIEFAPHMTPWEHWKYKFSYREAQ